jgi:hypothetical protein
VISSSKGSAAEAPTISIAEFIRLAGVARETWRKKARQGLMPAAVTAGIPRAKALAYLQKQAEAAAAAAARLRPATEPTDVGAAGE